MDLGFSWLGMDLCFDETVDNLIVEGLQRKGFYFETRYEIEEFIKERCVCSCYGESRTLFVDKQPFLYLNYSVKYYHSYDEKTCQITVTSTHGRYKFL